MPPFGPLHIAQKFDELAVLLELAGENVFKVRAHTNAARLVEAAESNFEAFLNEAKAGKVKGIGPALVEKLTALHETGTHPEFDELYKRFPQSALELLKIPGLGPKKVKALYETLGVDSISKLKAVCESGEAAKLKGFGAKTAAKVLEGILRYERFAEFVLFPEAERMALTLLSDLRPLASKIEVAGSFRRCKEIIRDLDFVAHAPRPEELIRSFTTHELVASVTGSGDTKASVVLQNGMAADLRVVSEEEYPAALLYFTGSKEHNVRLRRLAQERDLKLNEYGLWRGEERIPAGDEASLYGELGLSYIPPELREELGEIEEAAQSFAENRQLPALLTASDLKGILHAHSTYSDGRATLREMCIAARDAGYEYLGITDHSRSAAYAGGLSIEKLRRQRQEITALNDELAPFVVFAGVESDILPDGSLDYPDEILAELDFVIASVHSNFGMSEVEMTERILRAVQNPFTTILGHISGRLLLSREGYPVNIERVLEAAAKAEVAVELNCNPVRLELDWRHLRRARELGIKVPLCPDAHGIDGYSDLRFGVGIARKGAIRPADVLNCLSADALTQYFAARRERART